MTETALNITLYDQRYAQLTEMGLALHSALMKLTPLTKQMHLLSANAVCSAARAGSEGNAFRVLTQDIQLLGQDIAACITETEEKLNLLVSLTGQTVQEFDKSQLTDLTKCLRILNERLLPLQQLVNKGKYLEVFSAVEAANAGRYGVSFVSVAKMLGQIVAEFGDISAQQHRLLRDLIDEVNQLQMLQSRG